MLARLESDACEERKHRAYVGLGRSVHLIGTAIQKQHHRVTGCVTEGSAIKEERGKEGRMGGFDGTGVMDEPRNFS